MSLIDEIKIKSLSEAQEILKAAGSEDIFEKAHKDGDLHPNGKWVWVSSAAGGKGDWRTLNGRTHKKHQTANAASGSSSAGGNSSSTQPSSTSAKQTNVKSKDEKSALDKLLDDDPEAYEAVSQSDDVKWLKLQLNSDDKIYADAVRERIFEIDKNSKSNKASKTETYSHDINGVSVNVSKNKDGSYTLEANGKKVKSDDPSFFKDKLLPRVKKALAKELGIESTAKKTSTKKTTNGNSLKSKLDDIKRAISKNGYTANVSTDGSIVIYEKGARKTAENVKGRIKSFDDIDWGNKKGVQAKLESAIKAALSNDTQKSTKVQTFEAQNAAVYDKGDGKIGNYAKPETRSYRADALLRMMKNNIHLGFTYGMDGKKINEELKARGDKLVTVTMHKNGDGNDIYRVKFD